MDDKWLMSHAEDLADRALRDGMAAMQFLTPYQVAAIKAHFAGQSHVIIEFEGGYSNAERGRIVFVESDWGSYQQEQIIAGIKIEHRKADIITHRDVLGTLMAMGIKRETIGDISVGQDGSEFICIPEMTDYIIGNLEKIGRVGVKLSPIDIGNLGQKHDNIRQESIIVASARIDCLVSAIWNISRAEADEVIKRGLVFVDYLPCLKTDKQIRQHSIITTRGMGRVRLREVGGTTRKGRLKIEVDIFC